jgi:hypothetical protein
MIHRPNALFIIAFTTSINALPAQAVNPGTFGIVDTKPALSIGIDDGADAYLLHRVRGALRLADGGVAVANTGTSNIRVFDASGKFVKNVGRSGAGPAEFSPQSSIYMFRLRDSVIAIDEVANRFHVLDAKLNFVQTRQFKAVQGFPLPFTVGTFSDGSLLILAYLNGGALRGEPGTILRSQQVLMRYSANGIFLNRITEVEARPRYVMRFANANSYPFLPLVADPLQATVGNELFVLRGAKPTLEVLDLNGKVMRTLTWPAPLTRAATVWNAYKKADLATLSGQMRAKYEDYYSRNLPLPELAPTYAQIVVDSEKRLWLRRYQVGRGEATWDVVTTTGTWLGSVRTPARFTVYGIDTEYLLGRQLDDLDVERVQLLRWKVSRK